MLKFTKILYPLDLDSKNFKNVSIAIEFAKEYKAALHFLFVNDPSAGYRHPADFQDAVALKIKEEVSPELLQNAQIIYAVSKGDLDDEVKEYCRDNAIDLIITSHKHHNKLYGSLFDTPDENIIDSINIPVLVLPKN